MSDDTEQVPEVPVTPEVKPDPRVEDLVSAEDIAKAKQAGFAPVIILGDNPKVEFVPTSEGVQLAQGKALEEVLGVTKITVTEYVTGKYEANADGVIFQFTIEDILAAKTPPECVKAKYEEAKAR